MTRQKAGSGPETINLKIVPIGNSFGVRLSRPLLHKYGIEHSIVAEQRPEGILLRGSGHGKATLEQTFTEMAAAQEDWTDLEASTADGLDKLVW
ncbi:MAG: AbrB/MazE/SpoVT family DNA-binding domain-containing protein [Pseudomonadota bacterium]